MSTECVCSRPSLYPETVHNGVVMWDSQSWREAVVDCDFNDGSTSLQLLLSPVRRAESFYVLALVVYPNG